MKLFVRDSNNRKIYLNLLANSRDELAFKIGYEWFNLRGETYHVNDVYAESDSSNTAGGAIIGGLIGLLTGGAGALIGGMLGGVIGNSSDNEDLQRVRAFNASRY